MSKLPQDIRVSCYDCKHLQSEEEPLRCAAFPGGIPVWISAVDDSHLTPRTGDHAIRFEPSNQFLKWLEEGRGQAVICMDYTPLTDEEIEEAARITPADVARALELIFEASPELAKRVVKGTVFEPWDDDGNSDPE